MSVRKVGIQDTGWNACLTSDGPPLKGAPELIADFQCSPTSPPPLYVTYNQAWLEYKDDGEQQDPAQMSAVLDWIRKEPGPLFILVYVHGWHHNADTSNGDPRNNAIKFPLLMAREVDQLKRLSIDKKIAMPRVLGIYVGWRGEEYTTAVQKVLSISGRSEVADAIGSRGILKANLQEIANAARSQDTESRMMVVGHSLGGRMMASMFMPDLETGNVQPLGTNTMVVTLNPAVGANCYDGVFGENGHNPVTPRPVWMNVTSENDTATNEIYSYAHFFGLVKSCDGSDAASAKTIGHYKPYLRQVIDQVQYTNGGAPTTKDCMQGIASAPVTRGPTVWEPEWYKQFDQRLYLAFPTRSDTARSQKVKIDYTVCVGVEDTALPASVLTRGVWNVRTDKSLIDFDEGGGNTSGFHNGIISTVLIRLLTETMYISD
ncbi:hypothetical protein [Paraburkholderia unamae]|uniref:Uncharacterized protein n=1 Tax=Paraburkholderia unamae TaxID=219649 RepID=A0ACC6RWW9_9BURK